MAKFLALDGSSGTYASTPHSEAVDITGDLALVARVAPEMWDAGDRQTIIAKREASAHSFQWRLEDGVPRGMFWYGPGRSEEHTSELQSRPHLVCRLLLEKKK